MVVMVTMVMMMMTTTAITRGVGWVRGWAFYIRAAHHVLRFRGRVGREVGRRYE